MLQALLYRPNHDGLSSGGEELLEVWRGEPLSIVWLDLSSIPNEEETPLMETYFGLHPLAIEDAQRKRHPAKLEAFDAYTFILLKGLAADTEDINFSTIQLALFVGKNFLVTRHTGRSLSVEKLRRELERDGSRFNLGPDALALQLSRLVVDRYIKIVLGFEPRLEELEETMLEHPTDAVLAEIIRAKSDLKRLRRVFTYHEHLFRELKEKRYPGISVERLHEVTDVHEQQERGKSLTGLHYELASDLVEGYLSIASHRLNHIMKILTIVTAIFVPLGFLAGIYGMNFENMPELHSKSGYFILLGVMGTIATSLLLLFRKKQWL